MLFKTCYKRRMQFSRMSDLQVDIVYFLKFRLKELKLIILFKSFGKVFHTAGPRTTKDLPPKSVVVLRIKRSLLFRVCLSRLVPTVVRVNSHGGNKLFKILKTVIHKSKLIFCSIFIHCSFFIIGDTWSYFLALKSTTLAAKF